MSSRAVLVVLIRGLAMVFGLYLSLVLLMFAPTLTLDSDPYRWFPYLAGAIAVLLALIVARFASFFARLLLPDPEPGAWANEATVLTYTRAAICLLAVYHLASALAYLPFFIAFGSTDPSFLTSFPDEVRLALLMDPLGGVIVGLALLGFSPRIANAIASASKRPE